MKKLPEKLPVYGHNPGLISKHGTKPTQADIERIETLFGKALPQDPEKYALKVLEYATLRRRLLLSLERIRDEMPGVKS